MRLSQSAYRDQEVADRLNECIAVLAHELRNPLAPVKTTLEILSYQEKNPETKKLINKAQKQIRTMRRLLDDLLDVTRFSQGKFQIQREPANMNALVAQSLEATRDMYQKKKHEIEFDAQKGRDIWIDADPVRFAHIVLNILSNAAKYTEPGGRIEITHSESGGFAEMKIKDNGQGIKKENMQHIFEPFWQKDSVPRDASIKPPRKFRILVVDDNEAAATALTRLLNLKGYGAEFALNGREALESVQTFKPYVVLLDIGLPDVDGYEVARTLRERGFLRSIVAVSGYGQDEDKRRALREGFDHHFTKPVAIARLEEYFATL